MNNNKRHNQIRHVRSASHQRPVNLVLNSEGKKVHPDTLKAVRDFTEQFREALKELADR
ncbi:MAG: hypothetical protein OXH31_09745 [Gammaproteobacteria bacterium]|nr:hypothetical protein [Gammaproteobacteria bacterium]